MQSKLHINRKILKILLGGIVFFAFANIVNELLERPFWIITRSIYLGFDYNLPAWYSSMLFLVAALVGLDCFQIGKRLNSYARWLVFIFSGLLVLLAIDEIARFHETIGATFGKSFGLLSPGVATHTPWLLIGAPIALSVFGGLA